mgnify:CR=1 FL=1
MSLSKLKLDNDVEEAVDTLGSGGALESNIYPMMITAAFMGKSKGGAVSVTLHTKTPEGLEFKQVLYVTSGKAKGRNPYYEKNGKKYPMPSYTVVDDICRLTTDTAFSDMETEEKTIKLWDYDASKELPQEVDMLVDLIGESVYLAISKSVENKNVKNAEGNYVPTAETREVNDISKVFDAESKLTTVEIKKDIEEPEFFDSWLDKNEGKTRDKTVKVDGVPGVPGQGKKKKKMFA